MRRGSRGDAQVLPGYAVAKQVREERIATPDIETAMKEAKLARPKTRADCQGGPRPCPFATCRYNLMVEIGHGGMLRVTYPDVEFENRPDTCALDVADRGGETLEGVASILGVTRERVRQLEAHGLKAMRLREKLLMEEGWTP